MSRRIARILSTIFSPPSLLLVMVVLVGAKDQDPDSILKGLIMLEIGFSLLLVLYVYDYFSSKDRNPTPTRLERHSMYLGAVIGFMISAVVFGSGLVESELWFYFSMIMAMFFIAYYFVNKYFDKASLHLGVFGFVTLVLIAQVSSGFIIGFLLAPPMILSRIRLKKHEWIEIMWGWTIGLTVGLISWFI